MGIGNDDVGPLPGTHRAGPETDQAHLAHNPVQFDRVAHVHRPFEEHDQPADEIVHHVLQAESDPHAEGAGQDADFGEIDPQEGQTHQKPQGQDGVMQQARGGIGGTAGDVGPGVDFFVQGEPDEAREQESGNHRDAEGQDVSDSDADGAALEFGGQDTAAHGQDRIQQPQLIEQTQRPAGNRQPHQQTVGPFYQEIAMGFDHVQPLERPKAQEHRHGPPEQTHAGEKGQGQHTRR